MAVERSPSYPSLDLEGAIKATRLLWEKEKRSPVSVDLLARAIGHEKLSGPARTKIAALRQYGLINKVGGKYKIADRALPLVVAGASEDDRQQALSEAALAPPLFASLATSYPDNSDDSLRWHLINDLKFSEDGARRAVEAYRQSLAFAKISVEPYDSANGQGQQSFVLQHDHPIRRQLSGGGSETMSFNWLLPDGVKVHVAFSGSQPTPRALDRLISYLSTTKDDLPGGGVDAGWVPEGPTPKVTPRMLPVRHRPLRELEAEDDDNEAGLP